MSGYFNRYKKINKENDPFLIKEGESAFGKLSGFSYRLGWTEEILPVPGREKGKIGRNFDLKKINKITFALAFFLILLLAKTAWLQIVKKDYYYSMAEGNRIRIERIEPKRGIVYSNNLKPLVRNIANFLLYFIPADLPGADDKKEEIFSEISKVLGDDIIEKARNNLIKIKDGSAESFSPLFIADNIDYEKALFLYLKSEEWSGVILSNKTRREYDFCQGNQICATSLSHLLGYTGKISGEEFKKYGDEYLPIDYLGKTGIENFWESELRGSFGKKQIEVDALGKKKKILSESKAEDGHNLVLAVDFALESKLEEVIKHYLEKLKIKRAVGIVMNPNNGEILAMASIPSFDNNLFAPGIKTEEYQKIIADEDKPLFNRAVNGEYPSGSIIKPVMAAAALEENIVAANTTFQSVGGIWVGRWFFPDWRADGHGLVDIKRAIAESVNTYFYYIGGGGENFKGLGLDRIIKYDKLFGLAGQTGVDLPNEADGFLPSEEWKEKTKGEKWYIGDTYHLAIGQGDLLVTPLQVANYTAVFANGGKLYRPHLVKAILSSEDKVIKEIKEEPVKKDFINKNNLDIVRSAMRQTVTAGSARRLSTLPFTSAGKTGTAQWSASKTNAHAWFTGFAPYENPEVVITILVEQGGGGELVAVPIAKEVLEWYFENRK
jgi:penicillin-binding protein 2